MGKFVDTIHILQPFTSEFLVHAADNEGLQAGVDLDLIRALSAWCSVPVTYAGGARTVEDLELVRKASSGKVDLTIGSALDIFGGAGAKFVDCVGWNSLQIVQESGGFYEGREKTNPVATG